MTRCKLLKYKTKEDMEVAQSDDNGKSTRIAECETRKVLVELYDAVIVEELGQEYRLGASIHTARLYLREFRHWTPPAGILGRAPRR
jgi:hypothetical protein